MAVARERVAVSQGVAGQADDLSFLPFGGNNAQILAWLDVLLKGKPDQQAIARTEIAMLLEAKGFAEDAEEAYWTNVQARSTDRRSYDRLIELYQQRKDRLSESLVRRQLIWRQSAWPVSIKSRPTPWPPRALPSRGRKQKMAGF